MIKFLKLPTRLVSEDAKNHILRLHKKSKLMTNNKIEEALKHHLKESELPSLEEIIQVRAENDFCPKTRQQIDKRTPHKLKYGESRMPKSVVDIDHSYFWPDDDYRKFMHGPSQIEREARRHKMIEKDRELDERILAFMIEEDKKMKANFESTGFKKRCHKNSEFAHNFRIFFLNLWYENSIFYASKYSAPLGARVGHFRAQAAKMVTERVYKTRGSEP